MNKQAYTLKYLAEYVGAELQGLAECEVSGFANLQSAGADQLSFLANPAYEKYLAETNAACVIVSPAMQDSFGGNRLVHPNPYQAYAELSRLWSVRAQTAVNETQIHPSADIAASAKIGKGVRIDAGVVVAEGAVIADGVQLGANSVLGADSVLGENTVVFANVSIYHGISIGADCIIHSGVVIGSDGFGFSPSAEGWVKIEQLGGVIIGDKVEIGANSAIDRGALDNTVIGNGVILDNQIHIAHNVVIGDGCALAACSAVAGSTTLGKNVIVGGASGIAGHLEIADGVHITAMTMVIKSLTKAGVYSSGTGVQTNEKWRRSIARLRQLDKMAARVSALEKQAKNNGD